ncbi:MFS transporter [Dysgonomonas sp. 520]|uniref:MFS transporter n=1 Tax=Dysgonomonas sp. 520 TaxID=2302931 RepID=UPI0013D1C635|nr:MFS transporter [Dysgonomonas sp. 520]NDW09619.1 MFS transporter [Dysgonomonas sp. 520]
MSTTENKNYTVPIVMMIMLFAMISFVTNLAAPVGVIWKNQFAGSNTIGMLGNLMNFAAYLFMGIPAGKLLSKRGYKVTALIAVAVGFIGVGIQFLSGIAPTSEFLFSLPLNFYVYLLGAFVCGFCVCMLNTVVNPMLNTLGGGGRKGNQLLQIGGSFNSLAGTITPMLVGALIGKVTKDTAISDVNPVLFIAMGVFAVAFIILSMVQIPEPHLEKASDVVNKVKDSFSAWSFKHFVLGAIGIFVYVGVEIGIPGTMNYFLEDAKAGNVGATIAGFVTGTYWFLMLIGRFVGGFIGGKVSSKIMLTVASAVALALVVAAIFSPITTTVSMPAFTGSSVAMVSVPISALFLVLCGLCTSVMWGGIFNLAVEGLGKYVASASGIFMMMVVGGGILPLLQNVIADATTYMTSYWIIFAGLAYLLYYAAIGSKNVNKDIPVE